MLQLIGGWDQTIPLLPYGAPIFPFSLLPFNSLSHPKQVIRGVKVDNYLAV
jgi:hypothetical protein